MRGTIAIQILAAIFALFLLDSLFTFLDMRVFKTFFRAISEVIALAIIILFQPEIRRVLSLLVGNNPLVKRYITGSKTASDSTIHQLMLALNALSRNKHGALIAFERSTGLRTYIESGSPVMAPITYELLATIFAPATPLHDGAVIVRAEQIVAAKCILPVSQSRRINEQLGLRHRAALGLSEQTDAFVIIVSEETGSLSIADSGRLRFNLTEAELQIALTEALAVRVEPAPEPLATAPANLNPSPLANG